MAQTAVESSVAAPRNSPRDSDAVSQPLILRSDQLIQIDGALAERSELESDLSILIGGGVSNAKIVAKQNVVIAGGVVGQNACCIRAGGFIEANFASNADLRCEGDLRFGGELMNVRAWCNAELKGPQASVVGGVLYSKFGGQVGVLGSDANVPTRIFLGVSPVDLAEADSITAKATKTRETIRITRERVGPLLSNMRRLTPAQREQATELIYKAEAAEAQVAEDEKRREQILAVPPPKLVVLEEVLPGTVLSIQSRVITFKKPIAGPVAFELRKIRNATEVVLVDLKSEEAQVLSARQVTMADLMKDFEPLAKLIAP